MGFKKDQVAKVVVRSQSPSKKSVCFVCQLTQALLFLMEGALKKFGFGSKFFLQEGALGNVLKGALFWR